MGEQDGEEEAATTTTDVHDSPKRCKVVDGHDLWSKSRREARHRIVEDAGLCGMLGKELEQRLAMNVVERWPAGLDTGENIDPCMKVERGPEELHERPGGRGSVAAERCPQLGQ